jgi:hypothetical protein
MKQQVLDVNFENITPKPESFVYTWHLTNVLCPTNSNEYMKYVGMHKGTPDDGYTHSCKTKEFCDIVPRGKGLSAKEFSKNMPGGVYRTIESIGSNIAMKGYERMILEKAFESDEWDSYYNIVTSHSHFLSIPFEERRRKNSKSGPSYPVWTWDEEEKLIRLLLDTRMSYKKIGAEIGGRSRSAIRSKVKRIEAKLEKLVV